MWNQVIVWYRVLAAERLPIQSNMLYRLYNLMSRTYFNSNSNDEYHPNSIEEIRNFHKIKRLLTRLI